MRFYIKFESGFDKVMEAGCKLHDRMVIGSDGGDDDFYWVPTVRGGGPMSTSNWEIWDVSLSESYAYVVATHQEIYDDHLWHCLEVRIKFQTGTNSDGIVQSWVDGELAHSYTNVRVTYQANPYLKEYWFGLGNCSVVESDWLQSTFKSVLMDEFVLAEEYIGPLSGSSTTPTSTAGGNVSIH